MREKINRIVIIDVNKDSIKIANFLQYNENKVIAFLIIERHVKSQFLYLILKN